MVGRRVHTNSSEGKTYKSRVKAVTIFIVAKCVKNNCCLLQRGGVLIKKWGRSSAASTAVSIADAMKSLVTPTKEGDWFSSGVSFEDFTMILCTEICACLCICIQCTYMCLLACGVE